MKNRREDDGCCSRMFLKSIMIVFNTFFWLSGVAFLLCGLGSLLLRHQYVSLLEGPLFPLVTYLFLGIGGLVTLMGAIGCLGTLKEVRCCLVFYAFVLMLVLLVEACVGVLAYLYESAIHLELTRNLNQTMAEKYSFDTGVTQAVDTMQTEFSCCGPTHFTDWRHSNWAKTMANRSGSAVGAAALVVPDSCCISYNASCGYNTHPSNIYEHGCIEELERYLRMHLILMGGVAVGLSILQIFGILFSCCLSQKIKDERMV